MSEAFHPDRRPRGRKVLASCVCMGMLFLASACAGAETLELKTQSFEPRADKNQRDTKVTLIFAAPPSLKTSGEAHLLPASGESDEALSGSFEVTAAGVKATFMAQRGWVEKSFVAIELDEKKFDLLKNRQPESANKANSVQPPKLVRTSVKVDAIAPRALQIELIPQETTDKVLVFGARFDKAPESGAKLCGKYLKQGNAVKSELEVTDSPVGNAGLDVQFAIRRPDKPEESISGAELVLEVCSASSRWVYTGQLPELSPAGVEGGSAAAEQGEEQPSTPPESSPGAKAPPKREILWANIKVRSFIWGLIALACISLLAYAAHLAYGYWRNRSSSQTAQPKPEQPIPASTARQNGHSLEALQGRFSEALQRDLAPLERGIKELKLSLAELRERIPDPIDPSVSGSMQRGWEEPDGLAPVSDPSPGGMEANLAELVNRWWREGSDRERTDFLVRSPFIKAYRSVNIQDSLRNITNRTFTFQITDGPMEWLGRQQQGELLVVPCDPRQFQTGDSLKFLGVLFDGLGKSLEKVRFRRVVRPCRLQRDTGSQDRYRLVQRGQIEFEGQSDAVGSPLAVQSVALARMPQGSPSAPVGMSETKLIRIVQDAIAIVVPRDLAARVEELSQQVRSLRESERRYDAEPARLDPNVVAAFDAMRKGVAAFDGELRIQATAIQEIKSLVEALRGDLFRIESELLLPDLDPSVSSGNHFSNPVEASEIEAAVDRFREEPIQPLSQDIPFDSGATQWRSAEPVHVSQQLLERLRPWWPERLPSAESSPDGDQPSEPSAYLWRLVETQRVLARAFQQRGWQVSLVHFRVPEGSAQIDSLLEVIESVTVSRDYRSASYRGKPFDSFLLFQFALSIYKGDSQDVALVPAAGLRVDKHHHAYSRLTLGKLPERATRLTQMIQPAVLSSAGQSGLYTVVSPLKAEFR